MFQLTREELHSLRFQSGTSKARGGLRYRPYDFTEQGVAMLSSILKSDRAIRVNVSIMRTFVRLRQTLESSRELAQKFSELERRVDKHEDETAAIQSFLRRKRVPADLTVADRRRLFQQLMRRGFTADVIAQALKNRT